MQPAFVVVMWIAIFLGPTVVAYFLSQPIARLFNTSNAREITYVVLNIVGAFVFVQVLEPLLQSGVGMAVIWLMPTWFIVWMFGLIILIRSAIKA